MSLLAGAIGSLCLAALLFRSLWRRTAPWQLVTHSSNTTSSWRDPYAQPLPVEPVALKPQQQPNDADNHPRAPHRIPSGPLHVPTRPAPRRRHDSPRQQAAAAERPQQPAAAGLEAAGRPQQPVTAGLEQVLFEGRFSVNGADGTATFEWPLSTLRWGN